MRRPKRQDASMHARLSIRSAQTWLLAAILLLLAPGCGGGSGGAEDGGPPDAGPAGDAGADGGAADAPSYVTLPTCASPRVVMGTLGAATITGDTTDGPPGPRDLGTACGNVEALRWAPQEIIEYHVPGVGSVGVSMTLIDPGTPATFDTVLQVRTDCMLVPEPGPVPTCFDDTADDARSTGGFAAAGGDVVYLVVTGYAETPVMGATDRGPYTLQIEARTNALPEITGGEVRVIGSRAEIELSGADPDGDVIAFTAEFLDAGGDPVDLSGDGSVDGGDRVTAGFADDLTGMTAFTSVVRYADLGTAITTSLAVTARVRAIDEVFAMGGSFDVPVRAVNLVGLGATCDDMNACADPLTCTAGTCTAPAEVIAACAVTEAITLAAPTTTAMVATVSGTLTATAGVLSASCAATPNASVLYTVDVPGTAVDLIARTDLPATGATDTVLSVRSECADPLSELACNDDIDYPGGVYQSRLEVLDASAGVHTLIVAPYGPDESGPFTLEVTLRPVLATGAACDSTGVANRCAGGACAGGVCP